MYKFLFLLHKELKKTATLKPHLKQTQMDDSEAEIIFQQCSLANGMHKS